MSDIYTHPESVAQVGGPRPSRSWADEVEDMCVTNWTPFFPDDPRRTLCELIEWNVQMALDPSISSDAAMLIETVVLRTLTFFRDEMQANQGCSVGYFIRRLDEVMQELREPIGTEMTFP